MYRCWHGITEPLLSLLRPRRILEIGASRGRHTELLLGYCAETDAVLDVIDPQPLFPWAEWEQTHDGRLRVHRKHSLEALPGMPAADLALVDGDHNWHTVLQELFALAEMRTAEGRLPVIVLHDTGWPYARRDMYWDPAALPADAVRPHARGGVLPGRDSPREEGVNSDMLHALSEGGPRNGVRTAAEDFVAQRPGWTLLHVPGMHGFGFLTHDETLRALPGTEAFLRHLEAAAPLLEAVETDRLRGQAETFERREDVRRMERMWAQAKDGLSRSEEATDRQRAETARVTGLLERLRVENDRQHLESGRLRALIERMERSMSWRLTRPLRLLGALLGRRP